MPGAPAWQDFYDVFRATLLGRNGELDINRGDVADAYGAGVASAASMIVGAATAGFRSTLVIGNRGNDLTIACHDRGVDRDDGDPALVTVFVSRSAGGTPQTFAAGFRFATEPDPVTGQFATFKLDSPLAFAGGDLVRSGVATCTVNGTVGNVAAGAIDRMLDTAPAIGFTVTNPERGAGGNNPESDDDLITRTTQFPLVLRRGTADALEFAAKLAAGVRRATVVGGFGSAPISMYVCDVNGNSNAALAAAAQAIIDGPPAWRGASDIVNVIASALYSQDIGLSVELATGANAGVLLPKIAAAIVARLARLKPGEKLKRTMISTAGEGVDQTSIKSVTVVSPPADIVPTASQVIRAGTISF